MNWFEEINNAPVQDRQFFSKQYQEFKRMNCITSNLMKFLVGALMILGLSGNAAVAANNCVSDSGTFSSSIGSTTSCADHNMVGCVIGAGGSECTYPDPGTQSDCSFTVDVTTPGGVGGEDSTTFTVTGENCQARMAITKGYQGANYCAYFYPEGTTGDMLTTESSKSNKAVSHKQLEVCTDEKVVTTPPPVIGLEKKVVRMWDRNNDLVIDAADLDCSEATNELNVIGGPGEGVVYCYTISNNGGGNIDYPIITDDNGTPDDLLDDFTVQGSETTLAGGGGPPLEWNSFEHILGGGPQAILPDTGEWVNTAWVDGTFQSAPFPCDTTICTDSATVNVIVECDTTTQNQASATGTVMESRGAQNPTRCGPKKSSTSGIDSVSLLCDSSCVLRTECVDKPSLCAQPCEASGNWTYGVNDTVNGGFLAHSCTFAEPSAGNLPLCNEVYTNPANTDDDPDTPQLPGAPDFCDVKNPSVFQSDGHSMAMGRNPLLYYFPASGGGNSVGTIYCILLAGESASVCPSGSIVY